MAEHVETMEGVARPAPREARRSAVASLAENLAGGGAIALSIIGLAHIIPMYVASIAVIAIGAALLFEGGAIGSRLVQLMQLKSRTEIDVSELGGGIGAEFFGGAAGVVLGILSIVGVVPIHLIPIAVLIFGAAILMGGRAVARLNTGMIESWDETPEAKNVAYGLVTSAEGVQVLIGLAAVTLGIIAIIVASHTLVLSLVALLIIGFSNLVGGRAVNGKLLNFFHAK